MPYENVQTKSAYLDFVIKDEDVDRTFRPLETGLKPTRSWVLGLVNITNECYSFASIADQSGNYGKWFIIPEICKNCETNFDDCTANGSWAVILSLPNGSPPFNIRIATQPDQFGNVRGTEFLGITPSSAYEGAIIGIS